ncbi:Gibberellin 20 oxidase 3 [Cardamine amara subsp. amara]|uniref:Gibberellin 20 oxidase 3 n=1 Tax=Cardamine amara subsp. amara TaxID=228776 RepID=A0ABD1AAM5_CARAN
MKSITNVSHIGFDAKVINQQPNNIPIEFIWPDKDKPSTAVKELQVPIIDIAGFLSGQDHHVSASQASRLVSEAAKIHGFFLLTNHGIHEGILARAYKCMDTFFNLPAADKQKAKREWGEISGYADSFVGRFNSELPWKETLSFRFSAEEKLKNGTATVKDYISKTLGDGNDEFGY